MFNIRLEALINFYKFTLDGTNLDPVHLNNENKPNVAQLFFNNDK